MTREFSKFTKYPILDYFQNYVKLECFEKKVSVFFSQNKQAYKIFVFILIVETNKL